MSSKPTWRTYVTDTILFVVGLGIVLKQTGFPFLLESAEKPSVWYLITGALFCNGPVVLQALALRFGGGTSTPGPSPEASPPALPSAPSSEPSSGGS